MRRKDRPPQPPWLLDRRSELISKITYSAVSSVWAILAIVDLAGGEWLSATSTAVMAFLTAFYYFARKRDLLSGYRRGRMSMRLALHDGWDQGLSTGEIMNRELVRDGVELGLGLPPMEP